jgi:primosomal protein N' (replication factor Y)
VERTAEELGRAFPGTPVVVSRAQRSLPEVGTAPVLVLATPGIEPVAPGGYAAAVLLDGDVLLERPDLRAAEEALRRWSAAAALVRPATAGGVVVVCADPQNPAVQALVRVDPAGHAERELGERTELGLPPAVAAATVTGAPSAVNGLMGHLRVPGGTEILGPVPVAEPETRPAASGPGAPTPEPVVRALHQAAAIRSARREPGVLRIRVDPRDIG